MKNRYKKRTSRHTRVTMNSGVASALADPSRTGHLFKRFMRTLNARFDQLAADLAHHIEHDNPFDLEDDPVSNGLFTSLFGKTAKAAVVAGAVAAGGNNCGIGPGGFQKGNTCHPGGAGAKEEPKKDPVATPEFKSWFGESKVVDKHGKPQETHEAQSAADTGGKPLAVYHGNPRGVITEFKKEWAEKRPEQMWYGGGFYFTEDHEAGKAYASGATGSSAKGTGGVGSYYLKSHKPFDADKDSIDPSKLPEIDRKAVRSAIVQKVLSEDGRSEALEKGREFDEGKLKLKYRELTDTAGVGGFGASKQGIAQLLKSMGHDSITVLGPDVPGGKPGGNRFWVVFEPTQIKSTNNSGKFDGSTGDTLNAHQIQPRDEAGRFGHGVDPGKVAAHLTDVAVKGGRHARDKFKATVASLAASKIMKGLGKSGRWLKAKTKGLYDRLEQRYGRRAALAVFASGQAISWGAFLAGPALVGVPLYIPSAAAMIPGAAIAEVHRKMSKKTVDKVVPANNEYTANDVTLSAFDVQSLASELVASVESLWRNRPSEADIDDTDDDDDLTDNADGDEESLVVNGIADKLRSFKKWLTTKVLNTVLVNGEDPWVAYAKAGFQKGAGKAFDDTKKVKKQAAQMKASGPANPDPSPIAAYNENKQDFLKSAFAHPVAKDKIQILAASSYTHLEGVTNEMSTKIVRTLTDGLVQGKSPKTIAADLVKNVQDIGKRRAELIARTEIVRAHAEGQLNTFEALGVEDLGVSAEWDITGDKKVCKQCKPLDGVTFSVNQARGMLPRHPRCRCAWLPAVGQDPTYKGGLKSYQPKATNPTLNIELCECGPMIDAFSVLINANPEGCNQFTGPGCGGGLPKAPHFFSSDTAAVAANIKAVKEMRAHAEKGDLAALEAHPGTASPKVQAHKNDLIKHVKGAAGSPQETPKAEGGLISKLKQGIKDLLAPTSPVHPAPTKDVSESHAPEPVATKLTPDHIDKIVAAAGVTHKSMVKAALTAHADPGHAAHNQLRVKVTNAIYTGGLSVKDAVTHVMAKHKPAADLLKKITDGPDADRAFKEYSQTPYHDLAILSKITVKDTPQQGQAVCNMFHRTMTMGSTSVTGDFRHELGHAVHGSYIAGDHKEGITKKVEDLYKTVKEKVAADPTGMTMKLSHDEYQLKYGVVGRRALDNSKENFAEHYRMYHREVYRDAHEGGGGKYLAQYRERHPEWAKIWDAHYTAALMAMEM